MSLADGESGAGRPFREFVVTAAAPVLAIVTALIYGILVLAYAEFHAELGVRPVDAGVQYGPGLGGAAGIVALIAGCSIAFTGAVMATWWLAWRVNPRRRRLAEATAENVDATPPTTASDRTSEDAHAAHERPPPRSAGSAAGVTVRSDRQLSPASRDRKPTARSAVLVCVVTAFGIAVFLAVFLIVGANYRADAVKRGQPVEPLRIRGMELLSIRADLADVELLRSAQAPGQAGLSPEGGEVLADILERDVSSDRPLLYLGRSATSIVLYDSQTQRVLYIPAAVAAVRTYNCETVYRHPRCDQLLDVQPPPERPD